MPPPDEGGAEGVPEHTGGDLVLRVSRVGEGGDAKDDTDADVVLASSQGGDGGGDLRRVVGQRGDQTEDGLGEPQTGGDPFPPPHQDAARPQADAGGGYEDGRDGSGGEGHPRSPSAAAPDRTGA
ncbi:MAG TPA: hypothetical protein VIA06_24900 [Candidatus Dormibacteraeota bacterium]|jgi:hypothetical protein|nr:hypothetical protein [Candidatus Dormibacteraeota bacterium]